MDARHDIGHARKPVQSQGLDRACMEHGVSQENFAPPTGTGYPQSGYPATTSHARGGGKGPSSV